MTLAETVTTIDDLKRQLDNLRPLKPNAESHVWQKFRLDWNFHSNHIEGNSLTFGETKTFLLHGITAAGKPLKDHLDIRGHNEALLHLQEILKQDAPLSETDIRGLHKIILPEPYRIDAQTPDGNTTKRWVKIGEYKTEPNFVPTATGEMFYFAEPFETHAKMNELVAWYRTELERGELHPLILAATLHYKFIRIHPFDDGNGCLARILMNLALMTKGFPPVVIKTDDKQNYFRALQQADGGDLESFVLYIGEQLLHSLELMLKAARGEEIEEPDDLDKKIALLEAELKANDGIKEKRNPQALYKMLSESITPLLKQVEKSLGRFKGMFHETTIKLFVPQSQALRELIVKTTHRVPLQQEMQDVNVWEQVGISSPVMARAILEQVAQDEPRRIRFEHLYKGFKYFGTEVFDLIVSVTVDFEEFKLVINKEENSFCRKREKLYHQTISVEEQKEIANEIATEVFKQIEHRKSVYEKKQKDG